MPVKIAAFDAYGTLFDVTAAARAAAAEPAFRALAEIWPKLAADWRTKQLEYSWLRAVTGAHCDFWQVTQDGLDWAMEASDLSDALLRQKLLDLYWRLEAYPEVTDCLRRLRAAGMATAILSNGSPTMLDAAVSSAGLGRLLDDVLSVEAVGVFKPAAAVYDLVTARFDCLPREVLFVSSNGWDAGCAAAHGFRSIWINRNAMPVDRLPGRPEAVRADLSELPDMLATL